MSGSKKTLWLIWAALSLALALFLGFGLTVDSVATTPLRSAARELMLPGKTTSGHHQIELACEACHTEPFGGKQPMQQACVGCHGAELKEANDSHPRSKFTDPRNAEVAARLKAEECVTCHVEHRPQITGEAGFTLPADTCRICHLTIGSDRPSHRDLGFDTCANGGCHNFHDNRALYEAFLVKHADQPALLAAPRNPARNFIEVLPELSDYPSERYPLRPLAATDADAQALLAQPRQVVDDWLATAHSRAGANCSACHETIASDGGRSWQQRPSAQVCSQCHDAETKGFRSGKHGMRLELKLPAMSPAEARLPMRAEAHDRQLGCTSCHGAHRFDTRQAAVDACLGCHDDGHSRAYKGSAHYRLWRTEMAGGLPAGAGVSCATCHLPRIEFRSADDVKRILVQHNQSDNLRPNEKMIRSACINCHGLSFSIDALADRELVDGNFGRPPARHVRSVDMALAAEARAEAERRARTGND